MYKKILLTGSLFFIFITFAVSQKRPSELRKEKLEQQEKNKVFDETDQFFKGTEVPEKWKNESAVILALRYKYEYTNDNGKLSFSETIRKKIKLQDKAAIDEFSKFYFYNTSSDHKVGIRIIKSDGKITEIQTSDAVKVTTEIPTFFSSRIYGLQVEYNKIAIADLEVGDIIDFFQEVHGNSYNWTGEAQTFSPIYYTLQDEYPVVKQRMDFITERGYFINFKSLNGAPEIVKNANIDRRTSSFTLEDGERERVKGIRWLYSLRKLPSVKFQVSYAKIGTECEQFLGKVGEPKQSVTPQEIAEKVSFKYNEIASSPTTKLYVSEIESYIKKHHKEITDPMQYFKFAYYEFRHRTFFRYTSKGDYISGSNSVNHAYFVAIMREILIDKKIESKIVVTAPRALSDVDDIIMYDEIRWLLKVGDKYIYPFQPNSNIYETDDDVEGCNAYVIEVNKREKESKYVKMVLPTSKAEDHVLMKVLDVKIDDNMENFVVNSKTTATGLMKNGNSYAMKNTDYVDEENEKFGEPTEEQVTRNKTKQAEIDRKAQARVEEQKKSKTDQMKAELGDDFKSVVSHDDFKLEETGRLSEKPQLIFSEKYTLGEMVTKAGPNYSVGIAEMIGSQIEIKAKEKERDFDVYMNFPKTLDYTINLTIPDGYKAEGLESLKFNVDNVAGSFISKTELTGNILKITAKKVYKSNTVSKADWPKMIDFLDAAYNFTAKKIILKKK